MCCRNGARRQPPIVALAGAIYGAYQHRKAKRADNEASLRDLSLGQGDYGTMPPQQSSSKPMDGLDLHEKGIPPPSYDDVVVNRATIPEGQTDSKDKKTDLNYESDDEDAFLAAEESGETEREAREELQGVKMGVFERLNARKEVKRLGREERREAWRAEKRAWRENRAERRAEWRAARAERMGGRGCCRRAC